MLDPKDMTHTNKLGFPNYTTLFHKKKMLHLTLQSAHTVPTTWGLHFGESIK